MSFVEGLDRPRDLLAAAIQLTEQAKDATEALLVLERKVDKLAVAMEQAFQRKTPK